MLKFFNLLGIKDFKRDNILDHILIKFITWLSTTKDHHIIALSV